MPGVRDIQLTPKIAPSLSTNGKTGSLVLSKLLSHLNVLIGWLRFCSRGHRHSEAVSNFSENQN
jgi:hypothetical protein